MRTRRNSGPAAVLLILILVPVAGGCSSDDKDDGPAVDKRPKSAAVAVPLEATAGTITGKVPPKVRRNAVAAVARVVDRWFEAAWLDSNRAYGEGRGAWPGFTRDLALKARRDKMVTSNARLQARIDASHVVRRSVKVDLLGDSGRVVGATARFRLVLDTSGKTSRRVAVTGRLTLSPTKRTWRVFSYDVARSAHAVPTREGPGS